MFGSFDHWIINRIPLHFSVSKSFSKSTLHTLTRSTTNLEEISPQNKITPLTVVPNAPFEQSFRITVYLPHGQLYVARIGAKTKLSELLDMICKNKLLDASKFEFRHPSKFACYLIAPLENRLINRNSIYFSWWHTSIWFQLHHRWSRFEWNQIGAQKWQRWYVC